MFTFFQRISSEPKKVVESFFPFTHKVSALFCIFVHIHGFSLGSYLLCRSAFARYYYSFYYYDYTILLWKLIVQISPPWQQHENMIWYLIQAHYNTLLASKTLGPLQCVGGCCRRSHHVLHSLHIKSTINLYFYFLFCKIFSWKLFFFSFFLVLVFFLSVLLIISLFLLSSEAFFLVCLFLFSQ